MDLPDDLPTILFYRVGKTCKPCLPRRPVQAVKAGGRTNAPVVCPQIPLGTTGWMLATDTDWRPLSDLPKHWLPFLNRERLSPMDFRPYWMPVYLPGMLREED